MAVPKGYQFRRVDILRVGVHRLIKTLLPIGMLLSPFGVRVLGIFVYIVALLIGSALFHVVAAILADVILRFTSTNIQRIFKHSA